MKMGSGIVGEFLSLKSETDADLLAMQCGDFYEFFGEDAELVGKELDLRVSQKSSGGESHPMAGVPVDDLTPYLRALIERGYRVAVADQYETPDGGHAREVVRIVTPGTLLETDDTDGSFIAAIVAGDGRYGLGFADVTTGRFRVTAIDESNGIEAIITELYRFDPVEILLGPTLRENETVVDRLTDQFDAHLPDHDAEAFAPGAARHAAMEHFGDGALESLDLAGHGHPATRAAGALLDYVSRTGVGVLESMTRLNPYERRDHVVLDATTQRNLELTETMTGGAGGSVLETIDRTVTSGGSRLLGERLKRPHRDHAEIERRLDCVDALASAALARDRLRDTLEACYDLERLASRVANERVNPRDLLRVRDTLRRIPDITAALEDEETLAESPLPALFDEIDRDRLHGLADRLEAALADDPPNTLTDGGLIQRGYHAELDELIDRHEAAFEWVDSLEDREGSRHDITHLQVGRNKTDGYYIQVGRSEADAVPADYEQIKELKSSVRFTTEALREREREILRLEEQRGELEYELYQALRAEVASRASLLRDVGRAVAELDLFAALATHGVENGWVRPTVTPDGPIEIEQGRHPVVEQATEFVPNDASVGADRDIVLVTGPNMSGKSTYMRQVALIVLLAQAGSHVPADRARIGVVDGIYTRVGALDELAQGRSTFMVEMQELSNILHAATTNSLVVLDEVGRGTATYDGIAIAWAATEYIHNEIGASTFFATHYHELTVLAEQLPRVENVHVAAEERDGEVTFLRTVRPGPADRSYGIHVADLAGVPLPVVDRARDVLNRLREQQAIDARGGESGTTQVVFDLESGTLQPAGGSAEDRSVTANGGQPEPAVDPAVESVIDAVVDLDLETTAPIDLLQRVRSWQADLDEVDSLGADRDGRTQ